ncbi:MAG: tRNA preQ1(34) S-adenosylmethionine ribosyltransferase-isomerase QueA [Synergistaceae bacterium]|jgi:S-adenosylmethionine:tRNA ribosyltransferase-isomerase|nr:tRNA preQ1(34) S-adenosylmethionine ribosyltransferase-isomerase QueA [Synergistaceae bacterium]
MIDLYSLEAYDYDLPAERIAQTPAVPRDSSRLLVWNALNNRMEHRVFRDIQEYLEPGDLLVLNDTRVLPARLTGSGPGGGAAEILLLEPEETTFRRWKALVRPGRRLPAGSEVSVGDRVLEIEQVVDDGLRVVRVGTDREDVLAFLDRYGQAPLPPYIKATGTPRESYQTVFAARDGSVAAPTASLHFTKDLLRRLEERGTEIAWVTLHVGLGTFRPVRARDIRDHRIHGERCEASKATEEAIKACRARGRRVVAAGTTVARTLESMAAGNGLISPGAGRTELFIRPGFRYGVVDALLTNFHLPKSSLLMMVAAFVANLREGAAREETALMDLQGVYSRAVAEGYRFFSFGDAMFICGDGRK